MGKGQTKRTSESLQSLGSKAEFCKSGWFLFIATIFLGAFYLYQVNDLTNKGYEIKEMENQIVSLKKENEKNRIAEMELRSMYNIEKTTQNLDLVGLKNVAYLEIDASVAMK